MNEDQRNLAERLSSALQSSDDDALARELAGVRAADIAEVFHGLRDEDRSRVLFALPPHTAAEVVVLLDEADRGEVVEELDTKSLTEILTELPPDDAADVLAELPEQASGEILGQLSNEKSQQLEQLLIYGSETAGGIMTPDVVAVPASATVLDAVEYVREATHDEELHEIYIVENDRKLVGTVPLRRLVTAKRGTELADIAQREPVTVYAGDDQETVLQVIRKYDVMSAAVVDADGRLLGRITHDDLLDVAAEEAAEDLYRMAGMDAAEFETHSVFRAARIRLTWLLPCMIGMMLTATVLLVSKSRFDVALFGALVIFVPLIGAMSGNSGVQISTVIVRGFATGERATARLFRALFREGRIALVMAPVCGIVAWVLVSVFFPLFHDLEVESHAFDDPSRVALAVGLGMTAAIGVAGLLGIGLPFLFRRLGVDPAIASGPLVTTLNDVVSVSLYMTIAMLVAR